MYDTKLTDYKSQQADILLQMEEHSKADQNFYLTANTVVDLTQRAMEIFESSEPNEKRQLLNFLVQNCRLSEKTLAFDTKNPFKGIIAYTNGSTWQGR